LDEFCTAASHKSRNPDYSSYNDGGDGECRLLFVREIDVACLGTSPERFIWLAFLERATLDRDGILRLSWSSNTPPPLCSPREGDAGREVAVVEYAANVWPFITPERELDLIGEEGLDCVETCVFSVGRRGRVGASSRWTDFGNRPTRGEEGRDPRSPFPLPSSMESPYDATSSRLNSPRLKRLTAARSVRRPRYAIITTVRMVTL
jgi:hypothetical protein